jgi:hypothetical protein
MEPTIKPAQIWKSGAIKHFPMALLYILGVIAGLLILPFQGVIVAFLTVLTIFLFLILMQTGLRYARRGEWHRIVAELVTPSFLWLLFCVGGLINLMEIEGIRTYGPIEDQTILFFSGFVLLGAMSYVLGFRFVFPGNRRSTRNPSSRRVGLLLVVIILFDWFVRIQLIRDGLYFTWVMSVSFDDSVRGTNFLFHVQRTIWPIIFPLLLYFISKTRNPIRLLLVALLVFQLVFVFSTGDRRFVLYSILVILAAYGMIYKISINLKLILIGTIVFVIFFSILSPMTQEARFIMRRDGRALLADPSQIPSKFFFEYLPQVANPELIFNPETSNRRGLLGRIGSSMNYGANIYQAILDGKSLLSLTEFKNSMTMIIPRFLYPGKPVKDSDYVVQEHFGIGYPGFDANGTYAADIFAYFHVAGILLLFLVAGLVYGFFAHHLVKNYGLVGALILIGLLPIFVPMGDSFSAVLVNIRNILLLLLMVKLILHFGVLTQHISHPTVEE